jgi:hypothetical protein
MAVLCNIRLDEDTLPRVLSRMRDTNDGVRNAVFQQVLASRIFEKSQDGGSIIRGRCHPANLGRIHCMEVMRVAFPEAQHDLVKVASVQQNLIIGWVQTYEAEMALETRMKNEQSQDAATVLQKDEGLLAFLRDFGIKTLDEEGSDLLARALFCVFQARPDICRELKLSKC